jgi:hypothetical protein
VAITWRGSDGRLSRFGEVAADARGAPMIVRVRVTGEMRQDGRSRMTDEPSWLLHLTDAEVLGVQRLSWEDAERYAIWLQGPSPTPFRPSQITPAPESTIDSRRDR